jgi:hypothetical protein
LAGASSPLPPPPLLLLLLLLLLLAVAVVGMGMGAGARIIVIVYTCQGDSASGERFGRSAASSTFASRPRCWELAAGGCCCCLIAHARGRRTCLVGV